MTVKHNIRESLSSNLYVAVKIGPQFQKFPRQRSDLETVHSRLRLKHIDFRQVDCVENLFLNEINGHNLKVSFCRLGVRQTFYIKRSGKKKAFSLSSVNPRVCLVINMYEKYKFTFECDMTI